MSVMATLRQILEGMPVGFRFKPTDDELVNHYLRNKFLGIESSVEAISEVRLCDHEPWDLPALSVVKSKDQEWFFFSRPENMSSNSKRSKRKTGTGFWKPTGEDRDIKLEGTNKVIGTKKTLVFYHGRASNSRNTEWVIHEYRAVNSPPPEKTFVLCHLMRKTKNRKEERSNALVFPEGEPSNYMASDYENEALVDAASLPGENLDSILQGMLQAEEYGVPSIQPSPFFTENETSFQNSPFPGVNFGNETTEEDEDMKFADSLLNYEDVPFSDERQHAFIKDSTPSELLRRVYYESSDTDAEVVSLFGNDLGTSTAYNQNAGSREYRVMKMINASHGAANSSTQLTARLEASRKKTGSIFFGDSSGGFTSDQPSINCLQIASSPPSPRRCSPVPVNVARKVVSRRPLQRKASRKEKPKNEDRKEASTVESRKEQRKTQGTSVGKNLQAARNHSSGVNRIGSFIHLQTPFLSQNPMPRSVYLLHVVVGLFLLIVTIWDLISFAKWQ